ncbi:MAG TPA: CaiB/BaiF CoA-transferase family protein [Trebonia sp.]|jgi:alpha-methylacyl-CoA racemase|nr:CaiB/BaiF CoA-transferase family protein [Trebonia sp.]
MGPLAGLRVIEIAGRGPGPFAGMLLADMGADVVRVDRTGDGARPEAPNDRLELINRGRRSVALDLKQPAGLAVLFRLVEEADALFEGFRPGVAERLGFGPEACLARHPSLVYARATGWGQDGPLAAAAGHDIDYIALAGALDPIGPADGPPVVPLNLVGDYAGGGMLLAFGLVCGMLEARASGRGQVVDAAMLDGASVLMTLFHGRRLNGTWRDSRGSNLLDGGSPYYGVYETKDGRYVAIGAIERKFHGELLRQLGIGDAPEPLRRPDWPVMRARLAAAFKTRTRDEWAGLFEGSDACLAPVLELSEVARHPHIAARQGFVEVDGVSQPAPAPRFSRTPGGVALPPPHPGEHTRDVLRECGYDEGEIGWLLSTGAAGQSG